MDTTTQCLRKDSLHSLYSAIIHDIHRADMQAQKEYLHIEMYRMFGCGIGCDFDPFSISMCAHQYTALCLNSGLNAHIIKSRKMEISSYISIGILCIIQTYIYRYWHRVIFFSTCFFTVRTYYAILSPHLMIWYKNGWLANSTQRRVACASRSRIERSGF